MTPEDWVRPGLQFSEQQFLVWVKCDIFTRQRLTLVWQRTLVLHCDILPLQPVLTGNTVTLRQMPLYGVFTEPQTTLMIPWHRTEMTNSDWRKFWWSVLMSNSLLSPLPSDRIIFTAIGVKENKSPIADILMFIGLSCNSGYYHGNIWLECVFWMIS